jgi:heme/copper-type cytochrome/quinol oxidase subunit 3
MSKEDLRNPAAAVPGEQTGRSPLLLGMVLFLISEFFLFGSLFWTYYYLRAETAIWPPAGVDLRLTFAVVNTVVLLSSSLSVWWAGRQVRLGRQSGLIAGLALTVALGVAFLGITIFEWTHESFRPWSHAYGSIFYTLTGFHALHVFGGVMLLLSLLVRSAKGLISSTNYKALEIGSLYWHYVDFIWLIVFSSLFIVR